LEVSVEKDVGCCCHSVVLSAGQRTILLSSGSRRTDSGDFERIVAILLRIFLVGLASFLLQYGVSPIPIGVGNADEQSAFLKENAPFIRHFPVLKVLAEKTLCREDVVPQAATAAAS
jgi:hypothetical protein